MKRFAIRLGTSIFLLAAAAPARADDATTRVFRAKCASCHGEDGKGQTRQGEKMKIRDMTSPGFQKELTDEKVKTTILEGLNREKDGVQQEMKPLKGKLTPEQVDDLVKVVRSLGK